jgi:DNA-binding response OmpR family regulator
VNIENLKELKDVTKELTVLFVEDSQILQKQVAKFLDKVFKKVYQSLDGADGIKKYKEYKPDLVLTDITMPKKDGLDMIREIKIIDNNAKIIVISAHNDEEVISKLITLKVVDFLLKPLDIDMLIEKLLNIYSKKQSNSSIQCVHDLEMIYQNNGRVGFINYFKDILIMNDGQIVAVDGNRFTVKVPHAQILAINYEKNITIELKTVKKFMKLRLVELDIKNDLVYMSNPMYITHTIKSNKNRYYFSHNHTKVGLHRIHKYFEFNILEISFERIVMYTPSKTIELEVDDEINFTLNLNLDETKTEEKNIFAKGNIFKIIPHSEGFKIVSTLLIEDEDKDDFKEYLDGIKQLILSELVE